MAADSTKSPRSRKACPSKPRFPLWAHKGTGYWCRKFRGKAHYFGKVSEDPEGEAALSG